MIWLSCYPLAVLLSWHINLMKNLRWRQYSGYMWLACIMACDIIFENENLSPCWKLKDHQDSTPTPLSLVHLDKCFQTDWPTWNCMWKVTRYNRWKWNGSGAMTPTLVHLCPGGDAEDFSTENACVQVPTVFPLWYKSKTSFHLAAKRVEENFTCNQHGRKR